MRARTVTRARAGARAGPRSRRGGGASRASRGASGRWGSRREGLVELGEAGFEGVGGGADAGEEELAALVVAAGRERVGDRPGAAGERGEAWGETHGVRIGVEMALCTKFRVACP